MSRAASGLSGEDLAILLAPKTLDKIDGLLWPTQGPGLLDLAAVTIRRAEIYEHTVYATACSFVWHPVSAIATLQDAAAKAALASVICGELDDAEAIAFTEFLEAYPCMSAAIDAAAGTACPPQHGWQDVWASVGSDLWTFLLCGFQQAAVRNAGPLGPLQVSPEAEDAIVQLAFEILHAC